MLATPVSWEPSLLLEFSVRSKDPEQRQVFFGCLVELISNPGLLFVGAFGYCSGFIPDQSVQTFFLSLLTQSWKVVCI